MDRNISSKQHYPIFWKEGMRVSSRIMHLSDMATQEQIRDALAASVNEYSYGLLPGAGLPEISTSQDPNTLHLELRSCRAITRGGARIELTDDAVRNGFPLELPRLSVPTADRTDMDIFLTVLPFEEIAEGGEELRDTPPGRLHATPVYKLSYRETSRYNNSSQMQGEFSLKIAEVRNGQLDPRYIPACMQIQSCKELMEIFEEIIEKLEALLLTTQSCIVEHKPKKSQALSEDLAYFADKVAFFLTGKLFSFKQAARYMAPVEVVYFTQDLANTVEFGLDCVVYEQKIKGRYREVGDIRNTGQEILNPRQLDHSDLRGELEIAAEYIKQVDDLFRSFIKYRRKRRGGDDSVPVDGNGRGGAYQRATPQEEEPKEKRGFFDRSPSRPSKRRGGRG